MKLYTEDEAMKMLTGLTHQHRQAHLAAEAGVSRQFLSDVLKGRRSLNSKVAGLVGLRREVVFLPLLSSTKGGTK